MNFLTHIAAVLATVTITSTSVVKSPSVQNADGNFELLILHNNDMHARFEQTSQLSGTCTTADREAGKCYGGFPRVAHVVKEARRAAASGEGPPVLYLNAGDTYTGTAWFTIYKWKIAAEFINALEPDAVSLGNHEFDNGIGDLTPFIKALTCPVLAANLILLKEPDLDQEQNLKKSIVLNVSGTKVGIVGYLTPDTKLSTLKNDVDYIDEIVAIREETNKLVKDGVNIIIALGHSGYIKDQQIAKEVEGIDVVIGGHSHSFLWNGTSPDMEEPQGPYPTYVMQPSGRIVPVVQAYAYTKYLGKLYLTFDSNGEIISSEGIPILLDKRIPQDPKIADILERYSREVQKIAGKAIGQTSVLLDGASCDKKECNMGNLITDAIVHYYAAHYTGEHWTDVPIAFLQAGGIRASIDHVETPAIITKADLLSVMPFKGPLATVSMNGSVLIQMLEHSVSDYNQPRAREFLQMSGLHVIYNLSKPIGERVVSALAKCWACNFPEYFKVESRQIYKVIMPAIIAQGGDGFWMLKDLPHTILHYNEANCTIYYVKKISPIHPAVEGRITLLGDFYNSCSKSLGNHEFDEAVEGLVPFIKNVTTPVLAANLILNNVPEMQNLENLYNSTILIVNGVKIGVIGYVTPDTKFLAPRNKVEYEDEIVALKREVALLKDQNVKIIIALGHSGFTKDLEIAKEVEDLDLVIGGHSNTFLWNKNTTNEKPEIVQGSYPTWVKQASGRKVPVVQAYAYTKYLGKLHIIFDTNGEIIACDGSSILLSQDIPRDPELQKVIKKYRSSIDVINNEVVGSSMVFLNGEECRLRECNMGNMITDAVLYYTKQYYHDQFPDANIAVVQGGRIRTSINKPGRLPFEVTRGDLISVLPFSDTLSAVTMNGTVLMQTLEHSIDGWRLIDTPGQFIQVAGIKVAYDLSRPPGSRVVSAQALCSNCSDPTLANIKPEYYYKLIMPTFLADAGDGYSMFEGLYKEIMPYDEVTALLAYLKEYSPINPTISGRVTLLNEVKLDVDVNILRGGRSLTSGAFIINYNYSIVIFILTCIYIQT